MNQPDQLVGGMPVPDKCCWYRTITNSDHVTNDGVLSLQALKGKGAFSPTNVPGYSHELSGELVCLSREPVAHVAAKCLDRVEAIRRKLQQAGKPVPSKIGFMGVACANAGELRVHIAPNVPTNVFYTPINGDLHSDFVVDASTDATLDLTRAELTRRLRVVNPDHLANALGTCANEPR
jgi:hypothetical protein